MRPVLRWPVFVAAGILVLLLGGAIWFVSGPHSPSAAAAPAGLAGVSSAGDPTPTIGAAATVGPSATARASASGSTRTVGGGSAGGTPSGSAPDGVLYRDPSSGAAAWVAANPNDSRAAVIRGRIVSQPQARWFTSVNPASATQDAASYVNAANAARQVPVLSVYGITNRDCGGASSGGASTLSQYQSWITYLSAGLGHREVIVILEPDSVALQSCLSASDVAARDHSLSAAVTTIKGADAAAKVYLDGGHSRWNSASDQAQRLVAAGVAHADGFFTNVSNFNSTSNESAYGRSIIAALSSAGAPGKHQIIDTSRNGGSAGANGDWCADDNTDRRLGQQPTLSTGVSGVDGYLWIKRPGEADGCAFAAGSFQPTLAFNLAG